MKKYLAFLLAMICCLGCFAACGGNEPAETTTTAKPVEDTTPASTLADAVAYLQTLYKDAPVSTPHSYDMPAKVMIGATQFTVTWKVSIEAIKVVESSKTGFWTITIPENRGETAQDYVLTAVVKDASGKTQEISFNRVLPAGSNSGSSELDTTKQYKLFTIQMNKAKVFYATAETDDGKFIKTTENSADALLFKVEKSGDGFKLYFEKDGAKNYLYAYTQPKEDGSGKVSKFLCYSAENSSVWTYKKETNAWYTTYDNAEYVMGTYGDFTTLSLSDSSYMTAANSGVTQFPGEFLENGKEDPKVPVVENKDPEANSTLTIKQAIELGKSKVHDQYTTGKYYVEGVITEVYNEQYGNMRITDSEGNILTIYGTYSADGSAKYSELENKPVAGDTVKVYGIIGQYNDTPQMKNGWIVESSAQGGNTQPETNETPVTPPTPAAGATVLSGKLEDGMKIVIVNIANKKAFSSDPCQAGSYYQKGVDVTITDNTVTGYGEAEIWTVIANADGSYSFAQGGQKIGMQDNSYSSMSFGAVNDKWEVIAVDGGYNIKNAKRGNMLEWYASKNNWSTYTSSNAATDPLFVMGIYVVA